MNGRWAAMGVGIVLAIAGRSAAAVAASCPGSTPVSQLDSDGDGMPDACDPCPTSTDAFGAPSRDPYCFLGTQVVPPEYKATDERSPLGPWWSSGDCVPAMAFPIADDVGATETARGLVIVGARSADVAAVLAAARAGDEWPAEVAATCMVSFDYSRAESPITPVALRAPVLATLYATWAGSSDSRYTPTAGLGLVEDWPIETVATRAHFRALSPNRLQRLRFSRAVVYASDLFAPSSADCVTGSVPTAQAPWFDPTSAAPDSSPTTTCVKLSSTRTSRESSDWRVVPTALDEALLAQRDHLQRQLAGTDLAGSAVADALEGIPLGLRADDRERPPALQLLETGALIHNVNDGGGWTLVPEAVAVLRQQLHYVPDSNDYVLTPYAPRADASYSVVGTAPADLLVLQAFAVDPETQGRIVDQAVRAVETRWPAWPAVAATSEHSFLYGDRWTTNGGSRDCWTSTIDDSDVTATRPNQQLAYPIAVPANNAIATAFCPSALAAWRQRSATPRSQTAANQVCAPAAMFQNKLIGDLLHTTFGCGEATASSTLGNAVSDVGCCLNSFACPLLPFDECEDDGPHCCSDISDSFSSLPEETLECMASTYMTELNDFLPEVEWALVGDMNAVPMTALIRSEGSGPTLETHMSGEDMFVSGRHQGMDWNWKAEDPAAIDPAFRMIAVRDGIFMGIENELEFQVAMGQWTYGWRDSSIQSYNLHGAKDVVDYLSGLIGDRGLSPLGEIWSSDVPFRTLYGFKDNPYPEESGAFPGYWRHHYGRGMFAPITSTTVSDSSTAHLMAVNRDWPIGTTNALSKGITTLGLEDWKTFPHRLSFLGDPILDCGHSPYKVEIHPPHVLTMDLSRASYNGASNGVVVAAFGWANVVSPGTMEFDLWPPQRPSASARLVTAGVNVQLEEGAVAGAFGPTTWGWAFDRNSRCANATPTMTCSEVPAGLPNHVHCVYTDPSSAQRPAGGSPASACNDSTPYENPRMTPSYATSRFDMRIFMGWK